jgi:4-alpha-glucanotransferase
MSTPGRLSGILLPLFSLRSASDFGIGDFGALPAFFTWMKAARQRLLMVLPLLPTAPGDPSPYATRSAFGLNPLFIDLTRLPEWQALGGESALSGEEQDRLAEARGAKRIRYDLVFALKGAALARAFERFEQEKGSARQQAFAAYQEQQEEWLPGYALFAALSEANQQRPWWEWEPALKERRPDALAQAQREHGARARYHAWLQWVTDAQWQEARVAAKAAGVLLCGDEPFIIGQDSADAWCNPGILRRDARLGVPPDDFSAEGQDWGLPYFDFARMQADDYAWLKARAKNAAGYYDLRRVDHAVGYFRQYIRDERTPKGRFLPDDEPTQRAWGEKHFTLLAEGAGIVAEDLGVIPPFVREVLGRMELPGYRVMRWERDDRLYRDPATFPRASLATTGTHDTDTVVEWWEGAQEWEREAMARVYPAFQGVPLTRECSPKVHTALLASTLQSGSDLVVLPWQDVLATRDRVNLPGTMTDANWSYRIEQDVDALMSVEQTRQAALRLARLTQESGR